MHEYADRATLKAMLGLETDDATRDALLDRALAAASRGIDTSTGRRFWLDDTPTTRVYSTTGRTLWRDAGEVLVVDDIGSAAGLTASTGAPGAWTTVTDLDTSPDNAMAKGRPITGLILAAGGW
ncbi:phage gp6-like head-tail connector protein, partial [Streptomyces sp. NE06-03C]|nr:phage gp6-like head-tail connector protein [Streptomyces sp. NE06-03C]